ncbi:MAG: 16S rRNA (guanine(527)-N(7))-methyltransferase RsmG [Pseudoflavonifractor sp.]|nr:16S rRNA (guanine(527)-N(7))-methyltransferase RsmG [Alloprevotella sp.]MCM1116365.1 16S rRNA (guanine(527)-N(7))-methyltransferase RsmG [Pseudoflavonifractor sp.]
MDEIIKAFPFLTESQRSQLMALGPLYAEWNARINVVSRKDIDNIYPHHILHSLAIGKFMTPCEGSDILDLGTGGGFPGIPLAILWPQCRFHLIDRIGKKIRVANAIAEAVGLKNVSFQHGDIGECRQKFDYVVSRAVMTLGEMIPLVAKNISRHPMPGNTLPTGLVVLKGGNLTDEIAAAGRRREVVDVPLCDYFPSIPFFDTKHLLYLPL